MKSVFIVGTGNVATVLGSNILNTGGKITGVCGRNPEKSKILAEKLQTNFHSDFTEVPKDTDLVLICISDDSIAEVATKLAKEYQGRVAHCSGSVSSTVLAEHFQEYGVFYPLQTMSADELIELKNSPIFVTGSSREMINELLELGFYLTKDCYAISDEDREKLHLTAVVVNNFTHYILNAARSFSESNELPFIYLRALANETFRKNFDSYSTDTQTGPARRGDKEVIQRHLQMLENHHELKSLYEYITNNILTKYKQDPIS
jgi:predicted short-subunit dehydrogenase-like oxidoreductase (DUF2520 family)